MNESFSEQPSAPIESKKIGRFKKIVNKDIIKPKQIASKLYQLKI
jgi:hypothetical protein